MQTRDLQVHYVLSCRHANAGGKSLCFALPAAIMGKLVVVISPLIGVQCSEARAH